jgi:hypothetical protein
VLPQGRALSLFFIMAFVDLHAPLAPGPQYVLNSENTKLDDVSVIKTQQRLWQVVGSVNAIEPQVDIALILGKRTLVAQESAYTCTWQCCHLQGGLHAFTCMACQVVLRDNAAGTAPLHTLDCPQATSSTVGSTTP